MKKTNKTNHTLEENICKTCIWQMTVSGLYEELQFGKRQEVNFQNISITEQSTRNDTQRC